MEYSFHEIEKKWQRYWEEQQIYRVEVDPEKPKYYVLDMFPYPSGAGLHVGHPLGYIASDIYARYKRMEGYNVLHPMGYDAFGLPAEQYAIQTGQHPAKTTDHNIRRYREQLSQIGFSFDWNRELRTCDPKYYKWTQWAFIEMFEHWYDNHQQKARPIEKLEGIFSREGNAEVDAANDPLDTFSADQWNKMSQEQQQQVLLSYRIAYLADSMVNWCPELGTVLANDEVKEGVSVRGGYPVIQKKMKQWSLRVTAYANRLLDGLDDLEWSESLKEIQRNWIGRSRGAEIRFDVEHSHTSFEVFTTRPDTLFGVTFMVLAPESDLTRELTTSENRQEVEEYIKKATARSERDRITDTQSVSGVFTGSYALHPITGERLPIWVSDYVLIGYGTGAIMAVPAHDERDNEFARHFNLPIIPVIEGGDPMKQAYDSLEGKVINSQFINGYTAEQAIPVIIEEIEKRGMGREKVNYRLRDAIFSRQRYWGEPFPIYYKNGMPYPLDKSKLPLELPEVDAFKPTSEGRPPLARAKDWKTEEGYPLEESTMPGFAGSSAYYLRFMDPHNEAALVSEEANQYWRNVDLYVGGIEHATGHLIYSRFWNKFLYDIGWVCEDEPFKKLINQGMIQGRSNFVYRIKGTNKFVSYNLKDHYDVTPLHVDVNIVDNDVLDIEAFREWNPDFKDAEFILEEGRYICGYGIEKMSKSLYNVINPDDIIRKYGADTLRMYEMFLGPIDMSKPWDTNGIDGIYKFLKKFWRLFHDEQGNFSLSDEEPSDEELKTLHKTIRKVREDVEQFNFNTAISAMMIAVNELSSSLCNKRQILMPLLRLLTPFAPHIGEELWHRDGNQSSVVDAPVPEHQEKYLQENTFTYPVAFNGKMRFKLELPVDIEQEKAKEIVLNHEKAQKWLNQKPPKKVIFVPNKIINVVV
ncbi:MAG: leucine--tRNA ligase [Bacteroidales bacterium]|nr:leucine--tRNA ligase [Bacteroidales bacterium]